RASNAAARGARRRCSRPRVRPSRRPGRWATAGRRPPRGGPRARAARVAPRPGPRTREKRGEEGLSVHAWHSRQALCKGFASIESPGVDALGARLSSARQGPAFDSSGEGGEGETRTRVPRPRTAASPAYSGQTAEAVAGLAPTGAPTAAFTSK